MDLLGLDACHVYSFVPFLRILFTFMSLNSLDGFTRWGTVVPYVSHTFHHDDVGRALVHVSLDVMLRRALVGCTRRGLQRNGCREAAWMGRGMASDGGLDSHEDFQTKYKEANQDVSESIRKDVKDHRVMVYMKGTPDAPMCGFSNVVVQVLRAHGAEFGARNVLEDPDLREGIKKYTEWPTIPQVFIDGEFVGGADILINMHETGDLDKVLGNTGT